MKQYYLPPVLESNARRGYLVPDQDTVLATIVLYCVKLVKFRGLFFKKPAEKLISFMNIYYPIDIKCIDDKCMAIDPVRNEAILDHGIIGSIAFLVQHPSPKPIIESYIVVNAPDSKYSLDMFVEDYSIPALKTGPGRYFIAYNTYLTTTYGKYRVITEPPIYYTAEYPYMKEPIRVYNPLRKYIERINMSEKELLDKLINYRYFLNNSLTRKYIEEGLKKLYEKRIITPGDTLLALNILE